MTILSKLSIKSLKLNKKRTISTIIGIALSVALICAVGTLVSSFQETLIQNAINESGYYHLKIKDVTEDEIKTIQNNRDVSNVYTLYENGYGILEGSENELKPYLKIHSMDEETFKKLNINLSQGRFPQNSNEIIISRQVIDNAKVKFEIGDKIKIDVGTRETLDGYELNFSNLYDKNDEKLVNTSSMEFTIVGIIERPSSSFENYYDPGYTAITTENKIGKRDIYICLKNPLDYKNVIANIFGVNSFEAVQGYNENLKYDNYSINKELLRWEAFAFSDSTISLLYSIALVVIAIIIITSIFCIRNSFAIATTEKIKMYSMISSIGATKKQIKKNVILEAFILGIVGIPLGILIGIFAVFILINIVNSILVENILTYVEGVIFNVSILPIIVSLVLGFVVIYLSAISSARKASKVSPIEGLRNSKEIKINNKKLKSPKLIKKIFKTGGVLAYKNLKRSKKKYSTTVVSLAVSIFIFITMNSFLTNAFGLSNLYYTDLDYNILLYNNVEDLSKEEIEKINNLDSVDESFTLYESSHGFKVFDLDKVNLEDGLELVEDSVYDYESDTSTPTGKGKYISLMVNALDSNSFKKYVEDLGLDYEKVKTTGVLADSYNYYDEKEKNTKQIRRYKYNVGDTISGEIDEEKFDIKVGAVTDKKPYGLEQTFYDGGFITVDINEYKDKIDFIINNICINSNNTDEFEKQIKELNSEIKYANIEEDVNSQKSMILIINIFLYGFITVITLIGVTNIFNTITSNMELRQKEFAMLKSIGMTKKEFNKMINLETIFYSTKALIYGIILGLIGTFAMYKAFAVKFDAGMYIPIVPILISIVFVFILVFIIMKYSIGKINKQNMIETIRKENI